MTEKEKERLKEKPILIGGFERSRLVVHYGAKKYNPEKFEPIVCNGFEKPEKGGLWTSPIDSVFGWKDWNKMTNFVKCEDENSFTLCLKENVKIFEINSFEDLSNAPLIKSIIGMYNLNYEEIEKNYDAIWLTSKGQIQTRTTYPIWLNSWDCETVFILNPDCFIVVD